MSDKCDTCKFGLQQLENFLRWKKKILSFKDYSITQIPIGSVCFECIHLTAVKGFKKKLYSKNKKFMCRDCYIQSTEGRTYQEIENEIREVEKQ